MAGEPKETMTTNITLLIVTMLSTNVSTTNNAVREEVPYNQVLVMGFEPRTKTVITVPATERTETTIITSNRTISFKFEGQLYMNDLKAIPISTNVRRWKLKQEWKEEK